MNHRVVAKFVAGGSSRFPVDGAGAQVAGREVERDLRARLGEDRHALIELGLARIVETQADGGAVAARPGEAVRCRPRIDPDDLRHHEGDEGKRRERTLSVTHESGRDYASPAPLAAPSNSATIVPGGLTVERLVRLWFGFSTRIDRRTYVVSGVVLMLVKYLLDATVAWGVTGEWWSPWRYLVPLWSVRMAQFQHAPSALFLWLGLMTLPFFWIGVSMSVRRAADAGLPPLLGLGFAIPGVNFLAMLGLSLAASSSGDTWSEIGTHDERATLRSALTAIVSPRSSASSSARLPRIDGAVRLRPVLRHAAGDGRDCRLSHELAGAEPSFTR